MLKSILLPRELDIVVEEPQADYKKVPAHSQKVFGTISPAIADTVALAADTFIRIPMFNKGEGAIQMMGNSMKPYINNADWIVIRRITDHNRIIYGECYV